MCDVHLFSGVAGTSCCPSTTTTCTLQALGGRRKTCFVSREEQGLALESVAPESGPRGLELESSPER